MIYGDYDVDGTTSTALLTHYLGGLGADVIFFIPDRFKHGYGLSQKGLDLRLRRFDPPDKALGDLVARDVALTQQLAQPPQRDARQIPLPHHPRTLVTLRVHPGRQRRAEDRRPEVAGTGRHQQRAPVPGVEHEVVDDVAEEEGPFRRPAAPRIVRAQDPRALAGADQQREAGSRGELPMAAGVEAQAPVRAEWLIPHILAVGSRLTYSSF